MDEPNETVDLARRFLRVLEVIGKLTHYRMPANLEGQLGQLTSFQVMDERAQGLGLEPADPEKFVYLEVPGYQGHQPAVMAPPPEPVIVSAAGISPRIW